MEILILLLFAGALICRVFDKRGTFTYISAILALLGCALCLLAGVGVWECAGILLVFLLLNMGVRK